MAYVVPENLGSNKDVPIALRRVVRALQTGLDEDCTVWFEPPFDVGGKRPDLVVLVPTVGIVIIEVFVHQGSAILGAIRDELHVEIDGEEQEVASPLERADLFALRVRQACSSRPEIGPVPVRAVAAFPGLDRNGAEERRIDAVVELDRCLFKPDLDRAIENGNGDGLLRAFSRDTSGQTLDGELTPAQVARIRGLIHPECVIEAGPGQGALFTDADLGHDVVRVMDLKQEAIAKGLGGGHRVLRGVAGSGKTLVLVARAKMLARLLPSKRILLTCYTKSLASQLRANLADYPNIEVINLDKLMSDVIKDAGMTHPGYGGDGSEVAKVALEALAATGKLKYRAVLVDEAQDFDTLALQFCAQLLESERADEQDLVIVADSAQNIFRRNFTWKEAGIHAQGRTRILRINYRNTRQILEFAHRFLTADPDISIDETPEPDDALTIIPAESAEREGLEPTVTIAHDDAAEVDAVVELVRETVNNRSTSRSIAVLYGEPAKHEMRRGPALAERFAVEGIPHLWVSDPMAGNKDLVGSADEPVVLSTIHSAKGLEFPHVIVCGLGAAKDTTTARKLLYVGFTRAVDRLDVVTNRSSPFAADLPQSALSS